jgi:hypothetical protein
MKQQDRRTSMKVSIVYRIASVLLVLFAVGHTLGFQKTFPEWGVDSLVASMRAIHFDAQGFNRTYYDFYVGFGFFVTAFLLLAAVLAWQLGGIAKETLPRVRGLAWSLAICFAVVTALSWRYFFAAPIIFSGLITLCLFLGAWLSGRPHGSPAR